MKDLRNSHFPLLFIMLLGACQRPQVFNIKTHPTPNRDSSYDHQVIQVKSNRVQQECLFYNAEGENNWRHQYSMFVLNDMNEVMAVIHPINQVKKTCEDQLRKIEKILKNDKQVRICARGELKKEIYTPKNPESQISFGPLGTHKEVYRPFFLAAVCNSKECFNYDVEYEYTCPGFTK